MVRNQATLAGNICSGSPAADTVPPLLSLDAELCLASATHVRSIPLAEFYTGFKQNRRAPDELITGLSWAVPGPNTANRFYKLARRKGDAITVTGIAVTVTREGGKCSAARIALGAVGPTVFRAKEAEIILTDQALTDSLIDAAAHKAMEAATPIDDLRASADYRRQMVQVLTKRLLTEAWQSLDTQEAGR
jgi:carbon-monoxide dehydrogenase medium subunit